MGDEELWYRAVQARDARFDGWFFVAVTSTGIYCRPSCGSVVPRRENVRFFPSSAAAQKGGFRACKRCRPDASPASPEWNRRGDVVARAMLAIADGLVDRDGVSGLARHLGYSERHLGRLMTAELGAGPLDVARAQRAETARTLIETTKLPMGEVAFAAGFASIRQFNETIRSVFADSPTALRQKARRRGDTGALPGISLRLAFREPMAAEELFSFLSARAVPRLEAGSSSFYERALTLPHGAGVARLLAPLPGERYLSARLFLEDLRDMTTAVKRLRQLFDLDSDPRSVGEVLSPDPLLGSAVAAVPGLRIPGTADRAELCFRAVLGQQVSVAGARRLAGRLVEEHGRALPPLLGAAEGGVDRQFPSAATLAELDGASLPMPRSRARALIALARAMADGELDLEPGVDRAEVAARMSALPGIGPWTISYVAMRALADPDAFLPTDLGVRRALEARGLGGDPLSALAHAETWRPYRAYGLVYLWSGAGLSAGTLGKEKVA